MRCMLVGRRNLSCLASVSALAMMISAAPTQAVAQTQTASAEQGIEEITVTARRRAETILNVPVAVSAFDSTAIESRGIENLNDVAALTPGFSINNNQSSRNDRSVQLLIVRGMTPSSTLLPTSTIFIDGAPVSAGFVDGIDALERVEVLKGPQSAYFGRATFAGAINLVTKKPADEWTLGLDALGGTNNWYDVRITGEGPIIADKLSMRLSVRDYGMTGMYGNNGNAGGTLGDQNTKSANLAFYMTPIDDLKISVFGDFFHDDDGPGATTILLGQDYTCNAGAGVNGAKNYFCGALPSIPSSRYAADTLITPIYQQLLNNPGNTVEGPGQAINHGGLQRNAYHLHSVIDYALPDLGVTLSLLTAANYDHQSVIQDLDNQASTGFVNVNYKSAALTPTIEPFGNWLYLIGSAQDDVSQEFRLTSDTNNSFRWMFGGNYGWQERRSSLAYNNTSGQSSPAQDSRQSPTYNDTYALFGNLSYDVLDDLTISFDARYQLDHQANYTAQVSGPNTFFGSLNQRTFSPRVIVQYKITPDIMTYASWSVGNNVGGLLNSGFVQLLPFQQAQVVSQLGNISAYVLPESTQQYEFGVKGKFWGNRITVSTDVYGGTWTNQVVSLPVQYNNSVNGTNVAAAQLTSTSEYTNLGKTDLFGWEFDGKIKPIDHLILSGAAGIAKTDIRNFYYATGKSITGSASVTGNQLPNYPAWQANIGAEWSDDVPMWEGWSYFGRADAIYKDIIFADFTNKAWIPASTKFNFRVGLASESYSIEAFVLNAFNDKAYVSAINSVNLFNFAQQAIPVGLPLLRQVGLRLKYTISVPNAPKAMETSYVPTPAPAPVAAIAPVPAKPDVQRAFQVFFDFDKSDIKPEAAEVIAAAAQSIKSGNMAKIRVTGHTDTVGSNAYNQKLSERRANAVKDKLIADGVPASEIDAAGVGKSGLLVSTGDGVREPQNRRAQIVDAATPGL